MGIVCSIFRQNVSKNQISSALTSLVMLFCILRLAQPLQFPLSHYERQANIFGAMLLLTEAAADYPEYTFLSLPDMLASKEKSLGKL
jgi:hypothetical protein